MRIVLTTCPRKDGKRIAKILLDTRLAGCIVELDNCISRFWWKGKIERANESLLLIKTNSRCVGALLKKLKRIHPYEVPFIAELPLENVDKEYEKWLESMVKC